MEIKREIYIKKLINRMHNGMIKVITGMRRCGKSYERYSNNKIKSRINPINNMLQLLVDFIQKNMINLRK